MKKGLLHRGKIILFLIFPVSQVLTLMGNWHITEGFHPLGWMGILLGILADVILLSILLKTEKKKAVARELERAEHTKEMELEYHKIFEERRDELLC